MTARALAVGVVAVASVALADSPLTSTDFATGYKDVQAVVRASANAEAAYAFLQSPAPNDQKLAVANALGWQGDTATGFFTAVARAKDLAPTQLAMSDLSPSELFVGGYLIAMSNYLDLKPLQPGAKGVWGRKPLELLDKAAAALPDDFAVQYARALVQAQRAMDKDWCEVFRIPAAVVKAFPPAKRNLRPGALESAQGYLAVYEESCAGSKAQQRVKREELNQIYTLSKLGKQVVAGTQGGVVVWDPDQPKPVAIREGFICRGVTAKTPNEAAWIGCEKELVRWDGRAFTSFLPRTQGKNENDYYEPAVGPNGQLWVRLGAKAWTWNEQAQRFDSVTPPWPARSVYDVRYVRGAWWWVDFMNAVHAGERTFALRSTEYPGSDPRSLRVDEQGTPWVMDFEAGLYRWEKDRFVRHAGIDAKASGVAYDAERKRRWMLHYTNGLVLEREGAALEKIDLRELQYMRDLLLDANGDVWVGGWTELVRVRPDGPTWVKQRFRVK